MGIIKEYEHKKEKIDDGKEIQIKKKTYKKQFILQPPYIYFPQLRPTKLPRLRNKLRRFTSKVFFLTFAEKIGNIILSEGTKAKI